MMILDFMLLASLPSHGAITVNLRFLNMAPHPRQALVSRLHHWCGGDARRMIALAATIILTAKWRWI